MVQPDALRSERFRGAAGGSIGVGGQLAIASAAVAMLFVGGALDMRQVGLDAITPADAVYPLPPIACKILIPKKVSARI